jgi:hypothetical protein
MISEIKQIVENYINNRKPACLMIGTMMDGGVKVSEKLTVPAELVCGNLKEFASAGDRVRLIRDDGGQRYYILEIIGSVPAVKNCTVEIKPVTVTDGMTLSSLSVKDVVK